MAARVVRYPVVVVPGLGKPAFGYGGPEAGDSPPWRIAVMVGYGVRARECPISHFYAPRGPTSMASPLTYCLPRRTTVAVVPSAPVFPSTRIVRVPISGA